MQLETLIQEILQCNASDLHLKAGQPPVVRVHGQLRPLPQQAPLTEEQLTALLQQLTTAEQRAALAHTLELDFAFTAAAGMRVRVNVALQRGGPAIAIRALQATIPTIEELQLPEVCKQLVSLRQGLVLVTGPTGSGKSTTLAAMLEQINRTFMRHIVTIEDPIEYIFEERRSLFTQREVGADTNSFAAALKHALRQDPDVIMVGEMRDLETIAATLTAAETGHLVLATLHTPSAPESIDRIVDVFPAHQQTQIRTQLAMTLAGVISQRLLPRHDRPGRAAACEIMVGTSAIRNLIREAKTPQMTSAIQAGRDYGMQTLQQALQQLYKQGLISAATLTEHSDPLSGLRASTTYH